MNLLNTLIDTIAETFDIRTEGLTETTALEQIEGWDSVNALRLLSAIEDELGLRLNVAAFMKSESIGQIHQLCGA